MSNCIREGGKMSDFGINEMLEMQEALQEKYKDKWEHISPEVGKNKLLWMIGEVGEVIDIVKKHGPQAADIDNPERNHLIEDILLKKWLMCLCITMMFCFAMGYLPMS